ncbi:MAG: hypothetical protein LBH16_09050 [Treponema sp.]|jgi:hypothetical protein|nr:hypothetical protein [Treponema sp.]
MANESPNKLEHMAVIAGRNLKDQLLTAMNEKGCHVINVFYGKGAAKASYILDAFGLVPEENKILITCLILNTKAQAVFDMLISEFKFNEPNTGIAYLIPVDNLLY